MLMLESLGTEDDEARHTPPQVKPTSFEIVPVSLTKMIAPAGELSLSWTRLEALKFGLEDSRFKIQENFIYPEGNCHATVVKQSEKGIQK